MMHQDHYHALHHHAEYERQVRAFQEERRLIQLGEKQTTPLRQRRQALLQLIIALLSSIWN